MKRRNFLAFMAAGPMAAKAAAEKVALRHMGIATGKLGDGDSRGETGGPSDSDDSKIVMKWLREHGIPDWRMEDIEREAKCVRALDSDLACNTSMSVAAKMFIQRDRQLKRLIEEETSQRARNRTRDAWLKKVGISWWAW